MEEYSISEEMIIDALNNPDSVIPSYANRQIHQKRLNGYVLRVVIEKSEEIIRIITTYKARRERYEV